jgi:hypothetical protein
MQETAHEKSPNRGKPDPHPGVPETRPNCTIDVLRLGAAKKACINPLHGDVRIRGTDLERRRKSLEDVVDAASQ